MNNSIQDMVGGVTLSQPAGGEDPPRKAPKQSKPIYTQRANINDNPRAASSEDQGDYTIESHRSPTIEVHTTNPGSQINLRSKV